MLILSIDVGIKNLAYCLLNKLPTLPTLPPKIKIQQWDAVNLCAADPLCTTCHKKAKYSVNSLDEAFALTAFCGTHAKKQTQFKLPLPSLNVKKMPKLKLAKLLLIATEHGLTLEDGVSSEAEDVLAALYANILFPAVNVSANDMDLISLGVALKTRFDLEFPDSVLVSINEIIIENQISPIANRMKTLQGMIAQYFIMRGQPRIKFVSSSNKLKAFLTPEEKKESTYADRKKASIVITDRLLLQNNDDNDDNDDNDNNDDNDDNDDNAAGLTDWPSFFNQHGKKDDLADCYLQGVWYLNK